MKRDREFTIAVAAEANKLDERDLLEDYYATYARYASAFPLTPVGAVQAPLDLLGADLPAARTAQPEAFIDNSLLEELRTSGRLDGTALEGAPAVRDDRTDAHGAMGRRLVRALAPVTALGVLVVLACAPAPGGARAGR